MSDHVIDDVPVTYKFDRRSASRDGTDGSATAFRLSGDQFGRLHELKLVDWGDGGVGAVTWDPIEPGTVVSLGFANPGALARRGVVRRCSPCGSGYRVGIEFQLGLAA